MGSSPFDEVQFGFEAGDPAAKIPIPRSPPRLNLTGIALPALATFRIGRGSTGDRKPPTGSPVPKFQVLAASVYTVIRMSPPAIVSRAATHAAEIGSPSQFASGTPFRNMTIVDAVWPVGTSVASTPNTRTSGWLASLAGGAVIITCSPKNVYPAGGAPVGASLIVIAPPSGVVTAVRRESAGDGGSTEVATVPPVPAVAAALFGGISTV